MIRDALPGKFFQLFIGIAEPLSLLVKRSRKFFAFEPLFKVDEIEQRVQEPAVLSRLSEESEISAPRTAFMIAISKEVPIAMTSPVAFMRVPSSRFA